MARCKEKLDLDNVDEALGKLITAQIKFTKEALNLLGKGYSRTVNSLLDMNIPKGSACCDIPEPCWMPKNLGEICCQLRPGDIGEICFIITNEDYRSHNYTVVIAGEDSALVQLDANNFTLGTKERRVVSAKFKMPAKSTRPNTDSCCQCNDFEAVIWVQGCQNHYLNWYLNANKKTKDCYHEVCVTDEPDYILHWYDHFYIQRPCPGPIAQKTSVKR